MATFNHRSVVVIIGLVFRGREASATPNRKKRYKKPVPFSSIDGFPSRCVSPLFFFSSSSRTS